MTDNEKAQWATVRFRQDPSHLAQYGPTIPVRVAGLPFEEAKAKAVFAQIDTGASGSAISDRLAGELSLQPIDYGEVREAGRTAISAAYVRVRLIIARGVEIDLDIVALPTFHPPHDVLAGRDILASCKLEVDFLSGETQLHIRAS
jgi:predicted aspartyl protease